MDDRTFKPPKINSGGNRNNILIAVFLIGLVMAFYVFSGTNLFKSFFVINPVNPAKVTVTRLPNYDEQGNIIWSEYVNDAFGVALRYPQGWALTSTDNSISVSPYGPEVYDGTNYRGRYYVTITDDSDSFTEYTEITGNPKSLGYREEAPKTVTVDGQSIVFRNFYNSSSYPISIDGRKFDSSTWIQSFGLLNGHLVHIVSLDYDQYEKTGNSQTDKQVIIEEGADAQQKDAGWLVVQSMKITK